jgi:hypothetical protein
MSEFVSCKLAGGLGNWMFQISACYHVNKIMDKEVIIDTSDIATIHTELSEYKNNIFKKVKFIDSFQKDYEINAEHLPMEYLEIPSKPGNLKMHGYFQNENYVNHIREKILNLFEIDNVTLSYLKKKYPFIESDDTCSIHVRRGNYIERQNVHFVQPIEYYIESISYFDLESKHFIIFSDDIEWCKDKFSYLPNKTFIEGNKDYEDLYLMSLCKNNIIANSSFSWWGAWLNKNENKKVIYPSIWFNPMFMRPQHTGSKNWIKI